MPSSASLDMAYTELDAINQDEVRWNAWWNSSMAIATSGNSKVLPMRNLLMDFHVPVRLSRLDGERALTNLLTCLNCSSRWPPNWMAASPDSLSGPQQQSNSSKESILRLESDDDRRCHHPQIQGLEYPLVYLPFVAASAPPTNKPPLRFHDDRLHVSLEPDVEDERKLTKSAWRKTCACSMRHPGPAIPALGIAPYG